MAPARGERPQVVQRCRVDETPDRFDPGDEGGDEDRGDHEQAGAALGALGSQQECDAERDGGQRVAEVVDEVREQRDGARQREHDGLRDRREAEDAQRQQHRAHAVARALDGLVHQAVRVAMGVVAVPSRAPVRRRPWLGLRELPLRDAAGEARTDMLDVRDGLFEQLADVVVVEVVDDPSAVALADDQPEVAQQPKLMRDRRRRHPHRLRELIDRAGAGVEAAQDPDSAGGGERLHRLSDHAREFGIEFCRVGLVSSVRHDASIAAQIFSYAGEST